MITLPISLAALIILILLLGPVFCCITTVTTTRFYSKWERKHMQAREDGVARSLEELEEQKEALQKEREAVDEERWELEARRLELFRQAHQVGEVAKLEANMLEDQTELMIMNWEEGGV